MPRYEYACRDCGHTFEVVQSMSDEPLTVCPACGGELRKVFAAPAIAFKGSGFYATDHGKKAKKPAEKQGAETKGSGSEKSGEKPAAASSEAKTSSSSASSSSSGSSGSSGSGDRKAGSS
jgi:putative FmdB family regulatory protein